VVGRRIPTNKSAYVRVTPRLNDSLLTTHHSLINNSLIHYSQIPIDNDPFHLRKDSQVTHHLLNR